MRFAYYPGCSAKGTCPELHRTTMKIASILGIELIELDLATCCGAGVIQEKDPDLAAVLNIRTFAQAESQGLNILTVCGTCQGALGGLNKKLKEDESFWEKMEPKLKKVNVTYNRSIEVQHLLWFLSEEKNLALIKENLSNPLKGLKVAPFYGCHILRPSENLGFDNPNKPTSLENLIKALGAEVVEYSGKRKCCGFPVVLEKEDIALSMIGKHVKEAKGNGANCIVTPCPLCHMNLDMYQNMAEEKIEESLGVPVLHLPQLVAMGLGVSNRDMQTSRHMESTYKLDNWVAENR